MMGWRLVLLCLFQFMACFAKAGQVVPVTDCDRYAASELDRGKSGVPFEKIDPRIAIPACEDALRAYPRSARLVFELGRSYLKSGNFSAALLRFRRGAEQGYPPALDAIGTMYSDGSGVPKDAGEAVTWFRKAAESGYVGGQLNLGFMYEHGLGVHQDYVAALEWYRKAADQGSAQAQDSIGYFYSRGMGVTRDNAEAVVWLRKAAEQGMAGAQYNLGTMYEKGLGIPEDRSQALAWYGKSANQGNENAKKKLAALGTEDNANISHPPEHQKDGSSTTEFIGYGSRMGMDATVISKQGIGTTHAVIRARLTEENAKHYCEKYAQDSSQRCIDQYLRSTHLGDSITANCETGIFTTFYGEKLQFIGMNNSPDSMRDYVVTSLKDGSTLDGTSASGLSYDMEQFNALCPGRASMVAQDSGARGATTALPGARKISPSVDADWSEKLDIAKGKMTKCLQKLPKPDDGIEQQVERVIESYVASCGQDYVSVWRQGGSTEEQSVAAAVVVAYKAIGCRYSNPTQADMETMPQGGRSISCFPQDRVGNAPAPTSSGNSASPPTSDTSDFAARVRQRREAEEAKKPKLNAVTARGMSVVPGAIVCPNHDTVSLMFDLYVAHWTDTEQDALTNGQSRLLRGQPTPAPDLKFYGCALLPPGTPMMLERGNIVPVVTATLPDGTTIRGVTLAAMIVGQ